MDELERGRARGAAASARNRIDSGISLFVSAPRRESYVLAQPSRAEPTNQQQQQGEQQSKQRAKAPNSKRDYLARKRVSERRKLRN